MNSMIRTVKIPAAKAPVNATQVVALLKIMNATTRENAVTDGVADQRHAAQKEEIADQAARRSDKKPIRTIQSVIEKSTAQGCTITRCHSKDGMRLFMGI